jgi:dihydrolipoamide dehydrogenase
MDDFDVVVVGGGPGGYVAAVRAAQLGLKTALVERDTVGGICLNWGCIPSKSLLRNAEILELFHRADEFGFTVTVEHADLDPAVTRSRQIVGRMVQGVRFLLRKNGVEVFEGDGGLIAAGKVEVRPSGKRLIARNVILATGARTRQLPGLPIDGVQVMTSRHALELRQTPGSIVIVGGGPVGCEFAYIYRTYGAEVTILEQFPHLLPLEDEEISAVVERSFKKQGMALRTNTRVVELTPGEGGVGIVVEEDGQRQVLHAERVLVGIGVQGNSDGLGLEQVGVEIEKSYVPVNDRMATNVANVYAVGDLTGPPLLAHIASAQGVVAAESIAGMNPVALDYEQMPRATYCQPEVGSIGLTEAQARERGGDLAVGHFPFRGNGRALALGEPDGLVKVVADKRTSELLGIHMVGAGVTELLGEASLARSLDASPAQLGFAVHAHPTLSEAVKEAALSALGEAIHVWQGP